MHTFMILSDALVTRLGWVSLQAALLIALVWLACRLLPRLPATVRSALWWLVAAQLLVGFVWPAPLPLPLLVSMPTTETIERGPSIPLPESIRLLHAAAHTAQPATRTSSAVIRALPARPAIPWRQILMALWLVGLLVQLVVAARQWYQARELRSASRPPNDPRLQALCRQQAHRLGLRICPELRVCGAIHSPQILGLRRPMVLLPVEHPLPPDECAMALAHELAHLRRGDLWLSWAPILARALFFFHPLVHLALREYALNREAACDGEALRLQRALPEDYGRLLLRLGVERPISARSSGVASPSFHHLKRRIAMLEQIANLPRARDWLLVAVVALVFIVPYRAVAARDPGGITSSQTAARTDAVVPPSSSEHLSVSQGNGHGSLRWDNHGDLLVLSSGGGRGIRVVSAQPAGLFGLHESDVILGVNGQSVNQVGALLGKLRVLGQAPAKLLVRRNRVSEVVTLTAGEYTHILPPPLPVPPSPPTPPVPPQPPAPPPVAPSSGFGANNVDIDIHPNAPDGLAIFTRGLFTGDSVVVAGTPSDLATARRLYKADHGQTLWFRSGSKAYVTHDPAVIGQAQAAYAEIATAQRNADLLNRGKWRIKGPMEALQSRQRSIAERIRALQADASAPSRHARLATLQRQEQDLGVRIASLEQQLSVLEPQEIAMGNRLRQAYDKVDRQLAQLIETAALKERCSPPHLEVVDATGPRPKGPPWQTRYGRRVPPCGPIDNGLQAKFGHRWISRAASHPLGTSASCASPTHASQGCQPTVVRH